LSFIAYDKLSITSTYNHHFYHAGPVQHKPYLGVTHMLTHSHLLNPEPKGKDKLQDQ
jgi:hypothetical protein